MNAPKLTPVPSAPVPEAAPAGTGNGPGGVDSAAARVAAAEGVMAILGAMVCWGVFPLYWNLLQGIGAWELILHRILWSFVFLLPVMIWRGRWGQFVGALRDRRTVGLFALSGTLLSINWLTFVWGVMNGHVVETSLGYFMLPLFNVLLGYVFLRERPRPAQWAAVALAGLGVCWMIGRVGRVPVLALVVMLTFGFYALLRKRAELGSITGLGLETALLTPVAGGLLLVLALQGEGALGRVDLGRHLLLAGTGVVTAVPLLLYAFGARRILLGTVGLLQYVAPTIQFLLGVLVFRESFSGDQVVSFGFIWAGIAVFTAEGLWRAGQRPTAR